MEASFASRRPAAGGLPHFQLPPPNLVDSQVPRVTGADGLSPLSSSVNSGSSQSSQAGVAPYNPHGSWPLPGGTSSYTYGSMNHGQTGLMQPNYSRSLHSPSGAAYNSRPSYSTATGEGLAAPPYDSISPPFPLSNHGAGGSHHSMLSHSSHQPPSLQNPILNSQATASQPPTPSAAAPSDSYNRAPPTPGYYAPPASTPQQSSFPAFSTSTLPSPTHQSPSTTGPLSRGIPSMSGQPSPMQAPHYGNRPYGYQLPPAMGGAVLSNMTNPGGQMTLVGGMNPMSHGYPAHMGGHHMYSHGQTQPQQDRPFKCDVCTQCFNRNHDLKRHKRIHLAVKPFPCTFCDKSFSRKDALKRHRLVKGCGNGKTSPTDDNSSPQDDGKADADSSSNSGIKEES
ncbi:hypothetical protein BKA67DRAFT_663336 [Truncatella angustata]|uniref:C2H2-type domain-containing protein n=1 Tax=Truncatella angustata TaxID=152316 RepID=A0A9P8UD95_9PEZI|nr:uncharacterized protein BKA67DRAFT_663336 [Truncatella angustata]KAH6646972.1 hypothetical protein BKA67DRAFT_663336 [Truncatella angustata]KAH8195840.1 hypothetical protein TruAng_009993 [Truncatella angustata]